MTTPPHDPFSPGGPPPGPGGWTAPQQGAPAQGGWSPPPAAAPGAWSPPGAPANQKAEWSDGGPIGRSPFAFYFRPPEALEGTARLVYNALTVVSLPILIGSFLAFYLFKARYRRGGVTTFFAIYSHFIGTAIPYSLFFWVGEALGVTGHFVAVPLTVLVWMPLAARYVLPRLVRSPT